MEWVWVGGVQSGKRGRRERREARAEFGIAHLDGGG